MKARGEFKYSIILTLISPILGVVFTIKSLDWKYKKWGGILFITIFGANMIMPAGSDSLVHFENVSRHYSNLSFGRFLNELWHILIFSPINGTNDDVYIHVLSYVTGSLLGIPSLFFAIVAFVFGYFYMGAMQKVLAQNKFKEKSIIVMFMILMFIIYRGIDNMNTVRTWTGAWILFNGVYDYYRTKKKRYLLLMACAPLVHIAYFVMAIPAFAALVFSKFKPIYVIVIYFASFVIDVTPTSVIETLNQNELGASKVQGYYRTEGDARLKNVKVYDDNWYSKYGRKTSLFWGSNCLAITIILTGLFGSRMTEIERGLFTAGLLIASWANFGDFIDAFYNRTMVNAGLYILAVAVLMLFRKEYFKGWGNKVKYRKLFTWISIIMFLPYVIYSLSNILNYFSVFILAVPFIPWIMEDANMSLREFLGFIYD